MCLVIERYASFLISLFHLAETRLCYYQLRHRPISATGWHLVRPRYSLSRVRVSSGDTKTLYKLPAPRFRRKVKYVLPVVYRARLSKTHLEGTRMDTVTAWRSQPESSLRIARWLSTIRYHLSGGKYPAARKSESLLRQIRGSNSRRRVVGASERTHPGKPFKDSLFFSLLALAA